MFCHSRHQLNWVVRESIPYVVGVSSLLARYVANQTIAHILEANGAVALLRETATQRITTWSFPQGRVHFALTSDCAGAGTAPKARAQASWLVLATDNELAPS